MYRLCVLSSASGLLQIGNKLGKMTSQFADMTPSPNVFDVFLVLLPSLVTDPSFISTSSLVMELCQFFYKELTRNPEIGNTRVWVLPNIWRLKQVRDTKFGTNVSNKMLLNAGKCQGYSFYRFWVIRGKFLRSGTIFGDTQKWCLHM